MFGSVEVHRLAFQFGAALAVSLALTPICRAAAHRLGYVAKPKADRWHRRPTALLGGVAIVASVAVLLPIIGPLTGLWRLLSAVALMAALGLIDDLLSIKASSKLIGQIVIASLLLYFGYRLHWTHSLAGDTLVTLLWIVGVTNAFNLLDNMDGLCAGIGVIAGGFLLIGLVSEGGMAPYTGYLALVLGATAGFLVYNFNPASIFMGDTGSLFIGLNLAALTLVDRPEAGTKSSLLSVVAGPVLLLLIPILDTTLVTTMRVLSGRRISQGGRDHTSHRLVAIGLSERRAVMTLWGLAAAAGGLSVSVGLLDLGWTITMAAVFLLAIVVFAVYLSKVRTYDESELARMKDGRLTPLIADFMYKRRVAEVALDVCLIAVAYYAAYRLRFEGGQLPLNYSLFLQSLPVVLASQLLAFFVVGVYRGVWRYFGMMDAVTVGKGVIAGTVGAELILLYLYRFSSYSRAVFVIDAMLLFVLVSVSRASFRLIAEFANRRRAVGRRCLIYGAGNAGLLAVRELLNGQEPARIVGFIDDDPMKRRAKVHGYPVLGDRDVLRTLVAAGAVECVIVSTRFVDGGSLGDLETLCSAHDVELLRLQIQLQPVTAAS